MISRLLRFRRQLLTLLVAGGALLSGYLLWHEDRISPWTRDGRVRADSVVVAPDVSGLVVSVNVRDNQEVRKGEILFRIDPRRFSLSLPFNRRFRNGRSFGCCKGFSENRLRTRS